MIASKKSFCNKLIQNNINFGHLSDRQIYMKYLEYKLYQLLIKYSSQYDLSLLDVPINLKIKKNPGNKDYNILKRTHVTLNIEIYKLYESRYFKNELDFIEYVLYIIDSYNLNNVTIKELVYEIKTKRLNYINEIKLLK